MSEIGRWLENLGLGQLASTFAGAAIDLDILPEITENDLEKLDIPLGDRKRLMRAIAALGETLPHVASEALGTDSLATPVPRAPEAERRQLDTSIYRNFLRGSGSAGRDPVRSPSSGAVGP